MAEHVEVEKEGTQEAAKYQKAGMLQKLGSWVASLNCEKKVQEVTQQKGRINSPKNQRLRRIRIPVGGSS
jgi:hypothetical protein